MHSILVFLTLAFLLMKANAIEQSPDCIKLRACDAIRPCELQEDKRDCEPHWNCEGWKKVFCEIDKARFKTSCEAAKGAQNSGYAAAKASCETAKSAQKLDCERIKSLNHLGCAVAAVTDPIGAGINHLGKQINDEFCDLATGGAYKRGEAGCGVNAGVGKDKQGYYTYDTRDPDTKYRGSSKSAPKSALPEEKKKAEQLNSLAETLNKSPPLTYAEFDFKNVFGVEKFSLGKMKFGTPWPPSAGPLASPTVSGIIRGYDGKGLGGGGFLSTRSGNGEPRFHLGEDYVAVPNERIYSPISGDIVRIKAPGKNGLSGLEIRAPNGYTASTYYIAPSKAIQHSLSLPEGKRTVSDKAALKVVAGKSTLGFAQDIRLPNRYGPKITNHVHVTLQDDKGQFVSLSEPTVLVTAKQKNRK